MRASLRIIVFSVIAALLGLLLHAGPAAADGVAATVVVHAPGGRSASLAVDGNGYPVLAYSTGSQETLKVAVCVDASCGSASTAVVDSSGDGTYMPSLVLNAMGHPVISHTDGVAEQLNLTVCGDPLCRIVLPIVVVQSTGLIGEYSSVALTSAGNPVIAYHETLTAELMLAVCADPRCDDVTTSVVTSVAGHSIISPSLALNAAGNPIISYLSSGADGQDDVMLAICADPLCTDASTVQIDASGGGYSPSLVLDRAGNPHVSFHTRFGDLKLAACADAACTEMSTVVLESGYSAGDSSALALDSLGNPVIAYNKPFVALTLATCADIACSSVSKIGVDDHSLFGAKVGLVSDGAGDFFVSYYDADDLDLKVARVCGSAEGFADVAAGQYFTDAVAWAACAEVTTGTSATTFSPDALLTRGQMSTFLWRHAGEPVGFTHPFTDVSSGTYYEHAIAWMAANEITTGTSATTFDPAALVTRGQMSAFLWRLAGEPTGFIHRFTDVSSGAYYEDAIAWMAARDITTGTTWSTFSPNEPLSRGQAVTFLWRYASQQ